jgi:hypothetical protein
VTRPMFVIRSGRPFTTQRCRPSLHNSLSTRQGAGTVSERRAYSSVNIGPTLSERGRAVSTTNRAQVRPHQPHAIEERADLVIAQVFRRRRRTHIARRLVRREAVAVLNHATQQRAKRIVPETVGQGVARFQRRCQTGRANRDERATDADLGRQTFRARPPGAADVHVTRRRTSGHDYDAARCQPRARASQHCAQLSRTLHLNDRLRNNMPIRLPEIYFVRRHGAVRNDA